MRTAMRWRVRLQLRRPGRSRAATAPPAFFEPLENRLLLSGSLFSVYHDPMGPEALGPGLGAVLTTIDTPGGGVIHRVLEHGGQVTPGASPAIASGGDGGSSVAVGESVATAVSAFSINIIAGPGLAGNAAALAAFQRAAAMWEARITDPVTVNINADLQNLGGGGVIGQTSSVTLVGSYSLIRDAMVADAAAESDDGIVAFLPSSPSFLLPSGFTYSGNLAATKANLKALGFTGLDEQFGAKDAEITFNTRFAFDYDNSDGVDGNKMDFETVAAHEIGHALGFVSMVDTVDYYARFGFGINTHAATLDLFRFENNVAGRDPQTAAEFNTFPRSLRPNVDAVTDGIDAWESTTAENRMSTGYYTGDGRQASHWKDNNLTGTLIGMLDPTLAYGEIFTITDADWRALDLIGWDIAPATPEPPPPPPEDPPPPEPGNTAPVAVDDAAATDEDTLLVVLAPGVLANDSDSDGDAISVIAYDASSALGAVVVVGADGSYSYDPTSAPALQALAAGAVVIDTFTYTISDGNGGTASATVSVTVTGVNDAPVANDDSATVNNKGVAVIAVLANDSDIDGDALSIAGYTEPEHGSLVLNADNTFTYTAGSSYAGSDSFSYTISDGNGGFATATVTITGTPKGNAGGKGGGKKLAPASGLMALLAHEQLRLRPLDLATLGLDDTDA